MRRLLVAGATLVLTGAVVIPPAHATQTLQSFQSAAQAPVFQITEDSPTASFHPQGEGEVGYAQSTLDSSSARAFSTFFWPGSAAGNAGSLIAVAQGGSYDEFNDPVRAEVNQGSNPPAQETSTPTGSKMSASVQPESPDAREAHATTKGAAAALGPMSWGPSSSETKAILEGADLKVSAVSSASDIDIAGAVHIGSFTSSAATESKDGANPVNTSAIAVQDMTIGGQPAYVDGNGVHPGKPDKPADNAVATAINTALKQAGMSIYFTAPHNVLVGGVNYNYAGSVVFFWAPPNDSGNDSFTMALGGAAVATNVTAGDAVDFGDTGSAPSGGGGSLTGTGSGVIPADTVTPTLSLPATPGTGHRTTGAPATITVAPASATLPKGLGGWVFVALLAGLAGINLLTRLPDLLAAGPTKCPREKLRS